MRRLTPARAGNTHARRTGISWRTAHPRSRGEHTPSSCRRRHSSGSPPLARGTLALHDQVQILGRLTPARAGNTPDGATGPRRATAHPRSRGEHATPDRDSHAAGGSPPLARGTHADPQKPGAVTGGSPPLARGTPSDHGPVRVAGRLTPARAGNTHASPRRGVGRTAHPRSRGEHVELLRGAHRVSGSPPLARGTLALLGGDPGDGRLTPARAGNTPKGANTECRRTAHPRSRGEHRSPRCHPRLCSGSPPLARGTLHRPLADALGGRLTPARAGNTRWSGTRSCASTAHPRSRGEHCWTACWTGAKDGSPPLARGTLLGARTSGAGGRLTPARAGNTIWGQWRDRRTPAHPRSRGEHAPCSPLTGVNTGSPPLARGTRCGFWDGSATWRLTPARAGNTNRVPDGPPRRSAHPRSRGEHLGLIPMGEGGDGSPPLARGTLGLSGRRVVAQRLTPARAGNTPPESVTGLRRTAHPRSRGEHHRR